MKRIKFIHLKELPQFPRYTAQVLVIMSALGLTAVLSSFQFNRIEAFFYDLRVRTGPAPKVDPSIVLIAMDGDALTSLMPHAKLLQAIQSIQPKAVGYLMNLNQVTESGVLESEAQTAIQFTESGQQMIHRGIPLILASGFSVTGEVVPPYPLSTLPFALSVIHKDGNVFAEDQVTRRALHHLNGKNAFHIELTKQMTGSNAIAVQIPGMFQLEDIDAAYFFFKYHGRNPYPIIRGSDILEGKVSIQTLHNKTILIGSVNPDDPDDFAYTPYDQENHRVPKLVVHAQILDSALHQHVVTRLPRWTSQALTFILGTFILGWILTSAPLTGILTTGALLIFVLALGQFLYAVLGLWLYESQILLGIFLSYYLAVPYRLVTEFRKRWEFQRQNELLKQVEELKTNFISLVTHDLKTPVARIQGLTEMLIRKSEDRLNERDKQTVAQILNSTDDLNRFIGSILELNKIESHQLKIRLESKDINPIIERSVALLKPHAKARGIRIHMDLETLFPIRLDAQLISKVINNLIDNAIKYSPSGSDITIQSREVDSVVEVSVRDSGIGMTEHELAHLFTRFYRADNDATKSTIGTGLGLYLTKYFIEAHQGRVFVESKPGQGSVFKIQLPIQISPSTVMPGLKTQIQENSHVQSTRS